MPRRDTVDGIVGLEAVHPQVKVRSVAERVAQVRVRPEQRAQVVRIDNGQVSSGQKAGSGSTADLESVIDPDAPRADRGRYAGFQDRITV